ncbi:MAG TPA: HAMP domain-containing sensor histidine kinase [Chitinophagaceae bacterium]|nr:HAMP domain-containing sensor histidine kinase [Chitinophagaceae bacterium]
MKKLEDYTREELLRFCQEKEAAYKADLGHRQRLEDELRRAHKALEESWKLLSEKNETLQFLNDEKNRFIGMAAHDLNNPLTTVYLLTESLRRKPENLSPAQKEKLTLLQESVNRIVSMVKNLLNVSRIEEGRIEVNYEWETPDEMVYSTLSRFEELAGQKNLSLVFKSGIEGKEVLTDKNILMEILENLISNAIKFSPADKNIYVRLNYYGNEWELEVEDEGQGIRAEEMDKLYMRFQKLSTRPTAGESSTGLGLSIVKGYVETLNGNIRCESEWQKGTKFTIGFPINQQMNPVESVSNYR